MQQVGTSSGAALMLQGLTKEDKAKLALLLKLDRPNKALMMSGGMLSCEPTSQFFPGQNKGNR